VVIEGIDPSSSAYEAGAHPSTPYHQTGLINYCSERFLSAIISDSRCL